MAWIEHDPESGLRHDEYGGTHVHVDSGMTFAEEFPDRYFWVPWWVAALLDISDWIHGAASKLCERYKP